MLDFLIKNFGNQLVKISKFKFMLDIKALNIALETIEQEKKINTNE